MGIYRVEIPATAPGPHKAKALIVSAADATNAKEICKAYWDGDSSPAWDAATATLCADVAASADDALVGWRFRIVVTSPAGAIVADVEKTADATDDNIDEIGTALATLLNATASIANAAYVTATQVLTIATGSGGDDLGDHTVDIYIRPPATNDGADNCNVPGFIASGPTHEGAATDPLNVTFAADSYVVPTILAAYQGVA